MVTGTVREWWEEAGWGVLDSPATPGGCWAHFSAIEMAGYRALHPGEHVEFEFVEPGQDGYPYAAVRVVLPGRGGAVRPAPTAEGSHRSSLSVTLDGDGAE